MQIRAEVKDAIASAKPVVALESTLIAHGLPWPTNVETALAAEAAVRAEQAIPATIAVLDGVATIGLTEREIADLAKRTDVMKASRRDLAIALAQKRTAATTVSATMVLAHRAGIRLFATGGIGGAHRDTHPWDVSADLLELARTPVAVVCAGAKSILDIPRTLEILETHAVPVVGFGVDHFPAFYVRTSGEPVSAHVNTPDEAAALLRYHWVFGGAGVVLAQPVETALALEPEEFACALATSEQEAVAASVRGKDLTPFLLRRLAEITGGKSLRANQALVIANARLAAQIARS
jgi:pseudouridine-5'-phosphate glycosidase